MDGRKIPAEADHDRSGQPWRKATDTGKIWAFVEEEVQLRGKREHLCIYHHIQGI